MVYRSACAVFCLLLFVVGPAAAQPVASPALTVRMFVAGSPNVRGVQQRRPLIGDVLSVDSNAIQVRERTRGIIVRVPFAAIDRIERLKRHDPVGDGMKLLAATGGAWVAGVFAGRALLGTATTGAKMGAVALAGAAAWAAYTAVLKINERERWEPTDLDRVRDAMARRLQEGSVEPAAVGGPAARPDSLPVRRPDSPKQLPE
jgi:hypothetical protein